MIDSERDQFKQKLRAVEEENALIRTMNVRVAQHAFSHQQELHQQEVAAVHQELTAELRESRSRSALLHSASSKHFQQVKEQTEAETFGNREENIRLAVLLQDQAKYHTMLPVFPAGMDAADFPVGLWDFFRVLCCCVGCFFVTMS